MVYLASKRLLKVKFGWGRLLLLNFFHLSLVVFAIIFVLLLQDLTESTAGNLSLEFGFLCLPSSSIILQMIK